MSIERRYPRKLQRNTCLNAEKNHLKELRNKTRTSKVGAISKAQKAQNNFLEKNLKFLKKIFLSKKVAYSAEKCKRGTLLD